MIAVLDELHFTSRYPCTFTLADGTVNTSKLIVSSFFVFFEVFGSKTGLRHTQEVVTRLHLTKHRPDVDGRCLLYWNLASDTDSMPVDDADAIEPRTCSCSKKDVRDFAFGFFIDVLTSRLHPSFDQRAGVPFDSSFQGLSDDFSNNTYGFPTESRTKSRLQQFQDHGRGDLNQFLCETVPVLTTCSGKGG